MASDGPRTIRIAAALIDDHAGRLLLVRKTGTQWFMQAGGKIEGDESAVAALRRELVEEIGMAVAHDQVRHNGRFSALAANEQECLVDAEVFHIRREHGPIIGSEIAEAVWVGHAEAAFMPLAPLTRVHILPLARTLRSGALTTSTSETG